MKPTRQQYAIKAELDLCWRAIVDHGWSWWGRYARLLEQLPTIPDHIDGYGTIVAHNGFSTMWRRMD